MPFCARAVSVLLLAGSAVAAPLRSTRPVQVLGSGTIVSAASGAPVTSAAELRQAAGLETKRDFEFHKPVLAQPGTRRRNVVLPTVEPLAISDAAPLGFNGLDHAISRNADNGNQFNSEPADQAIAASETQLLQAVNDVVALYSPEGQPLVASVTLNAFFGLEPAITRGGAAKYGPFLSDPRVLYDAELNRWFVTALEIETDPATGAFVPRSNVLIAVSTTADATKAFLRYAVDVTDVGFGECPCLGDQPLSGLNHDGLFLSTNQFSFRTSKFQTALVLALDKRALASGKILQAVSFQRLGSGGGAAFSIQPANNAPGERGAVANGGTEFLLSSLDLASTNDDRIAIWSLTNTASLRTSSPELALRNAIVATEAYGVPPAATQKAGRTPLRDALNANGWNEPLEQLETGDDRMQQVVFANGRLYSTLSTVVTTSNGEQAGAAWFVLAPSATRSSVSGKVISQGYLTAAGVHLLAPAIALNAAGEGAISFTLTGTDYFPSAGFVRFANDRATEELNVAAAGGAPEDGFSGYTAFGADEPLARWGDYSGACVAPDGSLWLAVQYVPGDERSLLANWGSRIFKSNE